MKNFRFFLFVSTLLISLATWSFNQDQLKKIQDSLCADESLNKVQTEAAAPCIDCVAKESNSSTPASELKSVAKKVLSELEQNQIDQLEMEFYKFAEGRGLLSSGYSSNDSLENLEMMLKTYESSLKGLQSSLETYKASDNPEFKKELNEAQSTGNLGPQIKAKLKTQFSDSVKSMETHQKYNIEHYDTYIKELKIQMEKFPQHKTQYEQSLKIYNDAKEKAKSDAETSLNSYKVILEWLENSGKKEDLTSEKWKQVEDLVKYHQQVAGQYSNVIPQYTAAIQKYEAEMTALKVKIDAKKNVKYGEIHSPGTNKPTDEKLQEYRKKAAEINNFHKSNPGFKACGMSEAEILALRWYTANHYSWINKALRSGGDEAQKIEVYKKVLNNALEKLRAYDGEVRRGTSLPQSVDAEHQVGNIVNYQAYTSTSLSNGWSGAHTFVIKSKKGRYVGSHSAHYGENEVLFAAGTKFKITARQGGEITMEEVDP